MQEVLDELSRIFALGEHVPEFNVSVRSDSTVINEASHIDQKGGGKKKIEEQSHAKKLLTLA